MADGTITLEANADEKGVKVGMKEIEASVKRMSSSVKGLGEKAKIALQKQMDSISKLNNQYGQQKQKVEALRKRLKELSDQKIETEEYKRLGKEIDGLYEKSAKLEAELNQWRKLGVPENSNTFRVMDEELQKVISDISKLEKKQAEMKSSGTAYADPRSLSEYQSTASRLTAEEMRLDDMNNRLNTSFASTESRIGEINDKLEETKAKEARAAEEAKRLEAIAESAEISDEEIVALNAELQELSQRQSELKAAGLGFGYEEFDENAQRISEINAELKEYQRWLTEDEEETNRFSSSIARLSERLKQSGITGMKRKLHELWQALDKLMSKFMQLASGAIVGGLQKISGGIFGIHKSANKSTLSLKNLMKYAFGIRSLFALFNKIRSAATEGIQNLAQHDLLTNTGKVNQSLSELQSALTLLKNSFATAFAPLLTVASPILVQFINLISQAVTRVGMLIAALTGQKTFTKVIAVQQNYAASLDKTADSAKKAAKALTGYLSPIDEINRYDDGSSSSDGTGSGGGYTGPSAADMFEEVPIESSLKEIADKIKELVQNEDWEGLGAYIADGINKGLQKIYNVISWDNVGPEVTKFITAFTTTFNSLVDHINWELMGRTLGAGINTSVNTLNLLIGDGGIDFNKIGVSIARGLRGAIGEIGWTALGELLGNKFMIPWKMLSGFVAQMSKKDGAGITGWTALGKSIGRAMTGMFGKISLTDIANALVGVINGAFEILAGFDNEFDWESFKENLKSGIKTAVNGIKWKENGKAFGEFLSNLCDCITASITEETFYNLGKGIGDFLGQLPWGKLLWTAGKMIIGGLKWSLQGLWESEGLPGKIAAVIIAAFGAIKLGTLLAPIKILVGWIIGKIADRMIATESTAAISDGIGNMLSTALSGAATSATDFATALGPLVGTAGLILAVGGAATVATSELAGFVETMQGGNGIGSTFGNTMNNFIQTLQHRGDIISGSAEEIWQLKENLEQEGMTAEDKAGATQKLIDKLGEMGVTSDQAEQAFSSLYQQGLITDDMFDILSEAIKTLGDNTTNMAGSIDLSKQSIDDLYDNVLPQLQTQLGLSADQVTALDTALLETESSGGTAQDAFNRIMERAKELGINTESVAKIFAEVFPDAVRETESSTKTSMDNTKKSVETGMGAASAAAGAAMASIQKSTEDSMSKAEKSVKDSTEGISSTSDRNWSTAEDFATGAMENVGQYTYDKMKEVYGVVSRYNSSIEDDFNQKWSNSQNTVVQAVQNMSSRVADNCSVMASGIENAFSSIPDYISHIMNNAVGKVNTAIGNINRSISGIERGFTFSYNVQLPNGGRRWGDYHLNLPKVNTVPYLATGAVIPPRSEFLAVLGDQKNGRNLEAPESLIRQIIREETGGKTDGNTYNVSVSASGRKLLDIILEEGEMRRNRNGGRNPFKLDED